MREKAVEIANKYIELETSLLSSITQTGATRRVQDTKNCKENYVEKI